MGFLDEIIAAALEAGGKAASDRIRTMADEAPEVLRSVASALDGTDDADAAATAKRAACSHVARVITESGAAVCIACGATST